MSSYVHLLVSVCHPTYDMTINRFCLGVSLHDSRMRDFDIDHWGTPQNRHRLLSLLCEDWLSEGCAVVGCEEISGAVQWEAIQEYHDAD
jgi:hypothetical protein